MDEARNVLATFPAENATTISGDVSQAAIGGGFQLLVQVNALVGSQVICSDEHLILRAAPQPGEPEIRQPIGVPTATPPRRGG